MSAPFEFDPLGPPMPRERLEEELARANRAMADHRFHRPRNLDLAALPAWIEAKDRLQTRIDLLGGLLGNTWRPVAVPQPPKPVPASLKEDPLMPAPRKSYQDRIAGMTAKYAELCAKVATAPDKDTARRLRQQAHGQIFEIKRTAREAGLLEPQLAPMPENPFTGKPAPEEIAVEATVAPIPAPPCPEDQGPELPVLSCHRRVVSMAFNGHGALEVRLDDGSQLCGLMKAGVTYAQDDKGRLRCSYLIEGVL